MWALYLDDCIDVVVVCIMRERLPVGCMQLYENKIVVILYISCVCVQVCEKVVEKVRFGIPLKIWVFLIKVELLKLILTMPKTRKKDISHYRE